MSQSVLAVEEEIKPVVPIDCLGLRDREALSEGAMHLNRRTLIKYLAAIAVVPWTTGSGVDSSLLWKVVRASNQQSASGPIRIADSSEWHGCKRLDFQVDGRDCLLVIPKNPAKANPWIWRTEFFGTEPQTEYALLDKGYFVAYMDVQNMYGAPVSLDYMDRFYAYLQNVYRLAPRTVLEGFSRGGLFAFNWAARHPNWVASMYLDAPVCDFKSWPGGKGHGEGSPSDWQRLKRVYGLNEREALAYSLNPVDNLKPLADANIAIIIVCGDADTTVPLDENTGVVATRYKEMGGEIQVIVKPGNAHHPHSLKDPTPIVNFILAHH